MTNKPEPNTRAGEALKPCPFCGGPARSRDYGRGRIGVQCLDCRATSMLSLPGECAIAAWNTRHLPQPSELVDEYAPCPTCRQYSHSIGCDAVAAAFNHFQSMIAHPVRGHPMGDAFDEQTRDAAQVLMAQIAKRQADGDKLAGASTFLLARIDELDWSLSMDDFSREHAGHVDPAVSRFRQALTEWKDRA